VVEDLYGGDVDSDSDADDPNEADGELHCSCVRNCLQPFASNPSLKSLATLKQDERRRFLHMVMAFSIAPESKESARKKATREEAAAASETVIQRRQTFSYNLLGFPICLHGLSTIFGVSEGNKGRRHRT
jgi:hypothetical protein